MIEPSFSGNERAHERDLDAVAALVKLLGESGLHQSRIQAALVKPATPANAGHIADCYAAVAPRSRRPRAA